MIVGFDFRVVNNQPSETATKESVRLDVDGNCIRHVDNKVNVRTSLKSLDKIGNQKMRLTPTHTHSTLRHNDHKIFFYLRLQTLLFYDACCCYYQMKYNVKHLNVITEQMPLFHIYVFTFFTVFNPKQRGQESYCLLLKYNFLVIYVEFCVFFLLFLLLLMLMFFE